MEKCDECQIEYPDNLVQIISGFHPSLGGSFIKSICGICALKIINKIHNMKRKKFSLGSKAEDFRLKALRYRKENNKCPT